MDIRKGRVWENTYGTFETDSFVAEHDVDTVNMETLLDYRAVQQGILSLSGLFADAVESFVLPEGVEGEARLEYARRKTKVLSGELRFDPNLLLPQFSLETAVGASYLSFHYDGFHLRTQASGGLAKQLLADRRGLIDSFTRATSNQERFFFSRRGSFPTYATPLDISWPYKPLLPDKVQLPSVLQLE